MSSGDRMELPVPQPAGSAQDRNEQNVRMQSLSILNHASGGALTVPGAVVRRRHVHSHAAFAGVDEVPSNDPPRRL
jgi:hypothetical protein